MREPTTSASVLVADADPARRAYVAANLTADASRLTSHKLPGMTPQPRSPTRCPMTEGYPSAYRQVTLAPGAAAGPPPLRALPRRLMPTGCRRPRG